MNANPNSRFSRQAIGLFTGLMLIALTLFVGWLAVKQTAKARKESPQQSASRDPDFRPLAPAPLDGHDKSETAAPADSRVAPLLADIRRIADQLIRDLAQHSLTPSQKQAAARTLLAELRQTLRSTPSDAATAAILRYLETGDDMLTGLGFTLETGGILDDAPSMRTALLDLLGQFDPIAAAQYADLIFESSRIADEWALALRSLGWQNHDGTYTDSIRRHFHEMLHQDDWISQPGEGFLQAFDTAVHLGGPAELTEMIDLVLPVDANNQPVKTGLTHAAYLALDRMTVQNPLQTLETLTRDPGLLAWAPEHRASLVARADVSQPDQRVLVEQYLATLSTRPQELETFASMFPNCNGSLSHNLITTPLNDPGSNQTRRDAAALQVVEQWIQSGTYGPIESSLRQIAGRLTSFVDTANQ